MHENAVTKEAAQWYGRLSGFRGFYLVGGTALALQIGHRVSVDFDLFSEEKLPEDLLIRVKRMFTGHSIAITYRSVEQINLLIDEVKITFLHYPYPVLDAAIKFKGLPLASVREIAAMKAFAIGKRLSYKDYVDWFFMLKEDHVSLAEVIKMAQKKFGGDFNDRLFLGQLASMEDIPIQKINFLRDPVAMPTIETFLKKTVAKFPI